MLFGVLYGYLALVRFDVLRQSAFLLLVGLVFLATLVVIWKRYTYYLPTVVFGIALVFHVAGAAIAVI
jgi:hypothetical protein